MCIGQRYSKRAKSARPLMGSLRIGRRKVKVEENSAMPKAERVSHAKRFPSKAVSALGIAGASLAASTGGSAADMPWAPLAVPTAGSVEDILWQDTAPFRIPILDEEEISDVSLATFHLFDKEDVGTARSGVQLAAMRAGCGCGHGCGGCRGCRGCGGVRACRGCGVACRACRVGGCRGCGCGWGGCGGCGGCSVIWGWGGGCCLSWGGCSLWC